MVISLRSSKRKISLLINEPMPEDFITRYRKESFEAFKTKIQPVDGVTELIQSLDIPYCVASSGPEDKIRLNLELTGLLPYFENCKFNNCSHDPTEATCAFHDLDESLQAKALKSRLRSFLRIQQELEKTPTWKKKKRS